MRTIIVSDDLRLHPSSALHRELLRLWLRMREFEAMALGVDHLAEDAWHYPVRSDGKELHGGILWHNIDRLHGEIARLIEHEHFVS